METSNNKLSNPLDEELFFEVRKNISLIFQLHKYKESLLDFLLIDRLIKETIRDKKRNDKIYSANKDPLSDFRIPIIETEVCFRFLHIRYNICAKQDFIYDLWDEFWYLLQRYNEQEEML